MPLPVIAFDILIRDSCVFFSFSRIYKTPNQDASKRQDYLGTTDLLSNWNGDWTPSQDPMQQLALMMVRGRGDQVQAIIENNRLAMAGDRFTLVSLTPE